MRHIIQTTYGRSFLLAVLFFLTTVLPVTAQSRDISLTINVTTNTGESLQGQTVTLEQTDYSLSYGTLTLDANGSLTVKVYAGNHRLSVARSGYNDMTTTFSVARDTTVTVAITEKTQAPFSLTTSVAHDAQTGLNDVTLTWNREAPVFFDDFESYEPFAVTFGEWTGIDRDHLTAAPLQGSYPNRGVYEYAQIISPMNVEPTWWYDYPILRPYDGLQYVGFIRTGSNEANDDWLISPAITPGTGNVLQFMAHAADIYDEKFQVYVTTVTDNPTVEDFTMISSGNYESVDYRGWHLMSYDLSQYAGTPIKFAIRYLGNLNGNGAFMLMVDDVYVGQEPVDDSQAKARKAPRARRVERSPLNPNETFNVYLDGSKVGTTDSYEYTFQGLAAGTYRLGVQSVYLASQSDIVDTAVTISGDYARVEFNVTTNNSMSVDGQTVVLTDKESGATYSATINDGKASFASLPFGDYIVGVTIANYDVYSSDVTISADYTGDIQLKETIVTPYNITADVAYNDTTQTFSAVVKWNQNLSFSDSFESYDDFASGSFGGWTTWDLDGHICYPIGLGSATNIVNFPGASTTDNPASVVPLVFNPNSTTPSMASDPAVTAVDGVKSILFDSPQQNGANRWLVTPLQTIRDGYVLRFYAKSYQDTYPESFEIAISTTGNNPSTDTFTKIADVYNIPASGWTQYEVDLSNYAGQEIYIGFHYVSYDCFLAQIDNVFVGDPSGDGPVDVGVVEHYNVYLDGAKAGETTTPEYTLTSLTAGEHTVGVEAVYASATSSRGEYTFNVATAINKVKSEEGREENQTLYNLAGQRVGRDYKGIVVSKGKKALVKVKR